jgi:hypothetical protein
LKAERQVWSDFVQYVVAFANQRIAAIDDELQNLEVPQMTSIPLESQLEALPWKEAASKKCDYVRGAPADLIEKVRAIKGGINGKDHHFTTSSTEPTLFRFKRAMKQ